MDNEIEQIFNEQLKKLPGTVIDFISSTNWDADLNEIGLLYNLAEDQLSDFKSEATLVLVGLIHPNEFRSTLEQEVGIKGAILEAVVNRTEQKIFAPIRPALIEFFEKEAAENTEVVAETASPIKETVVEKPKNSAVQMADVAPDNLPTGETESFLPNLVPKATADPEEPTHPFEEKMKRVFTAGQQSMGDLTIEPTPQATVAQAPKAPPAYQADPYREPIE